MNLIRLSCMLVLVMMLNVVPCASEGTTQYEDPAGHFSLPIPADWTDESSPEVVRFVSPESITVSILAIEAADAESGDQAVLSALAPDLKDAEPVQASVESLPSGIWTLNIYAPATDQFVVLATQHVAGMTYGLLFNMTSQNVFTVHKPQIVGMIVEFSAGNQLDLIGVVPQQLAGDLLADFETYIEQAREDFHIPGVAIAIVQNGEVSYLGGFGTTEPNGGQPITAETLFLIGSLNKSMTTMMMGTLVDEGVLDWDQPVRDILPSFALSDPTATSKIRVRDLVNMSSGLPSYNSILVLGQLSPEEMIASIAEIPMLAAPGEMYNYNNQMVTAGGFLSALAAGVPMNELYEGYINLVQERVFDPIGMTSTTFDFDEAGANPNHALSFTFDPVTQQFVNVPLDYESSVHNVMPAGGAWSNAEDMARYLLTQLNAGISPDGNRVISEETLHTTQTQEVAIGGSAGYGMGWTTSSYNGLPLIAHEGNNAGFTSSLAFLPDSDLGLVVLTNVGIANDFRLSVREYLFELAYGLEHDSAATYLAAHEAQLQAATQTVAAIEPFRPDTNATIDPNVARPYLGQYEYQIKVEMRGDELWFVGPYIQSPLYPADGIPGTETGDLIGVEKLVGVRVRFMEAGDQSSMEVLSLFTGETLTFDKVE